MIRRIVCWFKGHTFRIYLARHKGTGWIKGTYAPGYGGSLGQPAHVFEAECKRCGKVTTTTEDGDELPPKHEPEPLHELVGNRRNLPSLSYHKPIPPTKPTPKSRTDIN